MDINKGSYMFDMVLFELKDVVGYENVSIKESDKIAYSVDYYWVPELWHDRGLTGPAPDYIVFPSSAEEISRIMIIANEYKIPVTVWGGGGGSQGGAIAIAGGILIDMKRLNKIFDLNLFSMTVEVGSGIIMQHLEEELEKYGVSTMHLPASLFCSTIGGFIMHRGTGVLSTKYGKMEDMIVSMEVVLPNGKIINTLPVPKTAAGPDLNQVFIGSEGTFGIVTKVIITVKKLPEVRLFKAFLFKDLTKGLEAGRKLMVSGLKPSVVRLYDEAETKSLLKRVLGIDREGAYLVYSIEGYRDIAELEFSRAADLCQNAGGKDLGSEPGEEWWQNKYKFFFPPYAFRLPQAFGTCDTVASFKNIERVYRAMKKEAESRFSDIRFIGHFSHWFEWGCMLYARFIFDNPPDNVHEAVDLYNKAWNVTVRAALRNGGVINEHHGVGLKLSRLVKEQYGEVFDLIKGLKDLLDPNGILNPYKFGLGAKNPWK